MSNAQIDLLSSPKMNKTTTNLDIEDNKPKKKIQGSTSFKNLNFIPMEFADTFHNGKEIKTAREPRKKIIQSVSLLRINDKARPSALSSRLRDNTPIASREIDGFSLCDQMKALNDIFPSEIKKNCNKICYNENSSKFFCAICNSEVHFSNPSSDPDYVFFGGFFYHINCMKCSSCSNNLQPPFYIIKSSKIYCSYCWQNQKSKFS